MQAETLPYWGKARPVTLAVGAKPHHLLALHCPCPRKTYSIAEAENAFMENER